MTAWKESVESFGSGIIFMSLTFGNPLTQLMLLTLLQPTNYSMLLKILNELLFLQFVMAALFSLTNLVLYLNVPDGFYLTIHKSKPLLNSKDFHHLVYVMTKGFFSLEKEPKVDFLV